MTGGKRGMASGTRAQATELQEERARPRWGGPRPAVSRIGSAGVAVRCRDVPAKGNAWVGNPRSAVHVQGKLTSATLRGSSASCNVRRQLTFDDV